jgi:predicted DCC family thiol-disulfide oxidoreductase YuxK
MPLPDTAPDTASDQPIVFFDGVCNLCNGAIQFLLRWERENQLRFAPLQSEAGKEAQKQAGIDLKNGGSMLLLENGVLHTRSTAALRLSRYLRFPWNLLAGLLIIPRPLRDLTYRFIARTRYLVFGRREQCMIPTPELKSRFLT